MKRDNLTNSYLSSFCLELGMLLQAGVPLSDGVLMLCAEERDEDGKKVLNSLLHTLEQGLPLSTALRESIYFPRYMTDMVDAGERTGRLPETLQALSRHYERQERLALLIRNAALYPSILLVMMVAVVLVLIVRVLPIFNEVFGRLGTQMSPLAQNLLRFGSWLGQASLAIAVVGAVLIALALAAWLLPNLRASWLRSIANIWGGSGIFGRIAAARFVSVMSLSLASGLSAEEAVELSATVSGGTAAVDKKSHRCLDLLRSGSSLADSLLGAEILSARYCRTLSLGSRNGMTDEALAEIAARSERDVQEELDRLVGKIEPTLVVTASVIVGIILLSVMLPLMGIMTAIG